MYITEAIEAAKRLHPDEYTVKECVDWCNELGSEIALKYMPEYCKQDYYGVTEIMLPEDVTIYNITKVISDGVELKKTTPNDYGYEYRYGTTGRTIRITDNMPHNVTIIYIRPYDNIRYIDVDCSVTFYDGYFTVDDVGIYVGDTLKITVDEDVKTAHITSIDDDKYYFEGDEVEEESIGTHIFREIQEKTLLPAPYDTAYIDFINYKVSLYQGASAEYQSFIQQCQAKLDDFEKWVVRNKPTEKKQFMNWW